MQNLTFDLSDKADNIKFSRSDAWALSALALMVGGLFSVNLATRSYPIDPFWLEIARVHAPIKAFYAQVVHSGRLPTWNPQIAMGYPFLAHSHGFFWYPLAWVFYFYPFMPAATFYKILHLLLLAGGSYLLMRSFGARAFGAFAGAASMSLGGYAFENMGYMPLSTTYTWTPLAIFIVLKLLKEPRLLWVVLLAFVTLIQSFGGDMEVLFYQWVYISLATGLAWYFSAKKAGNSTPESPYSNRLVAIFGGAVLGGMFALIQFLPLFEFFGLSDRQAGWTAPNLTGSFFKVALFKATMVLYPLVPLPVRGHFEGLGFVALAFGLLGWLKADRRVKWIIGCLFLFCLLDCQQFFSPFRWLIGHFPIIKGFRFPMRLKFFLHLTASMAAAFGVDYFIERTKGGRVPAWLAAGLLLFGLAAYYGGARLSGGALAALGLALFIARLIRMKMAAATTMGAITAILVANLGLTSMAFMPRSPSYAMEAYPAMKKTLEENLHGPGAFSRSLIVSYKYNGRLIAGMEIAWKGYTVAFPYSIGYRRYTWYYSLMVPRAVELDDRYERVEKIHPFYFHFLFYKGDYLEEENMPWFDLAGVKYLFSKGKTPNVAGPPDDGNAHFKLMSRSEIDIYENDKAYPRAFLAPNVKLFDDFRGVFRFMRANPGFDFRYTVLLESGSGDRGGPSGPTTAEQPLPAITGFMADRVDLTVETRKPSYLVLTDIYAPGWTALVNGRVEKVVPADGAFRAVSVPGGKSRVSFIYKPYPFRIGLWFSLAGIMAGFVAFLAGLRSFAYRS